MAKYITFLLMLSYSLCSFSKERYELNESVLKDAFFKKNLTLPTDSVDNLVWANAKIESLMLHQDTGPFEKGDSLYLHKTFYVVGYRIVSPPEDKILGQSHFTYRDYTSVTWLISEDLCDAFKVSYFQFGFPPSINTTCERVKIPDWFASLYSTLPKPQFFWHSNIYGLKYFD